ncbi:DUF305 domain-containing protein [Gallibacterium anatis]|uniref:Uncharacterized protein conserved in bacteria n=1 Tax=Gallibacterium anatis TaxID=750 RepID=A0A1A7PDF0_9PAST|nr:DUF305 domain-containing protein [Gallibacterium anatis]KGQ58302.1 hypothetical protein IE01_01925 [Gallibacterium anatis DSM 16844 = F 149]OBW96347.1 hypothetical protein QV02_03860 [Gallibacterium anatis]OBW99194.1 hypothetical protein QV03_03970 [Gallibacterium anatis]STO38400.1 Uncharacterized protein conserved in bacteria [Gallibacterium anatis]
MKKLLSAAAIFVFASSASAGMMHSQHMSAANEAYMQSMGAMHDSMMKGISHQDPDVAFAAGMLPHHQGAVAMAEVELKYGKDPELRQLAENIIKAQQAEIKFMQQWLEKHGEK